MIEFDCPECSRPSRVIDAFAGGAGKCAGCFAVMRAPDPDDLPAPDDDSPPRWGSDPRRVEPFPATPASTGAPCPTCGEPLNQGVKKCRFCGAYLRGGRPSWASGWDPDHLAGLRQRVVAGLIDLVLYGVAIAVAAIVVEVTPALERPGRSSLGQVAVIALLLAAGIHIVQALLLARAGASVGMRACNIKVVRFDGEPATFLSAVVMRSWAYGCLLVFAAGTLVLTPILLLCEAVLLLSPQRLTLRDQVSGTAVIRASHA